MYIGFFDSGIGGITVLYEALNLLPNVDYLYYADTQHVPYGIKEKNLVKRYIHEAADFIIGQGVDALVIACNTATSIAIQDLRKAYNVPIIGMEPAVKPAVEICGDKRVIVLATPLTLKEDKFEDLISKVDSDHIVDSLPLTELVTYAEKFRFNDKEIVDYLKDKFSNYDLDQYGTLVLGCTHFVYYKKVIKNIIPEHIDVIDGNLGTIRHLKNLLSLNNKSEDQKNVNRMEEIRNKKITFYTSGVKKDNNIIYKYLSILD